ncbi:hypothetical protein [Ketogulonicigenium vulgare]|nr:hypothetical protein [Ketogulonicigenium vulgare]
MTNVAHIPAPATRRAREADALSASGMPIMPERVCIVSVRRSDGADLVAGHAGMSLGEGQEYVRADLLNVAIIRAESAGARIRAALVKGELGE